jgi:hypothetical protein
MDLYKFLSSDAVNLQRNVYCTDGTTGIAGMSEQFDGTCMSGAVDRDERIQRMGSISNLERWM